MGLTPTSPGWMVAYFVIQALDGNLLVPCSFSEAVNLHPVAIIIAVLVFGGLWGFLGRLLRHSPRHPGQRCSTPGPSGKISPPCPDPGGARPGLSPLPDTSHQQHLRDAGSCLPCRV